MSSSLARASRGLVLALLVSGCESDPVAVPDAGSGTSDGTAGDGSWGGGDGSGSADGTDDGSDGWGGSDTSGTGPDASSDDGSNAPIDAGGGDGSDGADGADGTDGTDGADGTDGTDGTQPPPSFTDPVRCNDPNLQWRSGSRTTYESYPDPGSEECIEFSGCEYVGRFSACRGTKSEEWVAAHNIAAVFPDFGDLELHDLCLRQGDQVLVVTVYDTCGDHDCDGCCTRNKGDADQLIDLEMYTDARWDARGRDIEWADLGPTQGGGCESEDSGDGEGGWGN